MEFTATESGFKDGLGGASNSAATADYHYVLFGHQTDDQHPEYSGIYFEFDDQINGSVDCVTKITITNGVVEFMFKDGKKIVVRRGMEESPWSEFLRGIYDVFGDGLVRSA
jgi:hypothetical protein